MEIVHKIMGCTVEDGPGLSYNNMSACWQDKNWARSWRHITLEKLINDQAKLYPQTLLKNRVTVRHQKAVDPTGKIVGYARWILPESVAVSDGVYAWPQAMVPAIPDEEEAEIHRIASGIDCKPINSKDDHEFDKDMFTNTRRYLASKPFLNLDYLAVHPDNKRKGIASALIQSGIRQAKALNLDVFVLAYQAGINLYTKQGFQILEELVSQLSGEEEPYRVCFMAYEQNKPQEQAKITR